MSNATARKGLHPGWWMIITTFLVMVFVYAPVVGLVGLFYVPVSEALGVTRTAVSLATTIGFFASVPACLLAGKMLKMTKIRYTVTGFIVIGIITYVICAFTKNLMVLYVCYFIRGFASPLCPMISLSVLSERWFGPKARGKAVGIATVGSGVGTMIFNPITAAVIENFGYMGGYLFFAILSIIPIPFILKTWKESPAEYGHGIGRVGEVDGEGAQSGYKIYGPTTKQAMLNPVFWIGFIAMFLLCGVGQSIQALGASCNVTIGFDAVAAASLVSFVSFGIILGKLVLGWLFDKCGIAIGMGLAGVLMAVGYIITLTQFGNPSYVIMAIGMFITGLGVANCNLAIPLFTSALVGNRAYGTLVSWIQMATSLAAGLMPTALSSTYETSGTYHTAWIALIIGAVLYAVIAVLILSYRKKHSIENM